MSNYFYGWYFRCQGTEGTVAVIPAVHLSGQSRTCSVQVLTESDAWGQTFPASEFHIDSRRERMQVGKNMFSREGIHLQIEDRGMEVRGELRFGAFSGLKYDIMGPFAYLPRMECRHSVYSMRHRVKGELHIGSRMMHFNEGLGYMEGDSGMSFPRQYVWTQHFLGEGSLMLAAATIPFPGFSFTGTVGSLLWKGREYRFATYLGASVKMTADGIHVRQRGYELKAKRLDIEARLLRAPQEGEMSRMIGENLSCKAEYQLSHKGKLLFCHETDRAAFEYEAHKL